MCIEEKAAELAAGYGRPYIARTRTSLDAALGVGVVAPKTMANLDSAGQGCPERILVGGRTIYPAGSFYRWWLSRGKFVKDRNNLKGEGGN